MGQTHTTEDKKVCWTCFHIYKHIENSIDHQSAKVDTGTDVQSIVYIQK
jgi:hypothetical protein